MKLPTIDKPKHKKILTLSLPAAFNSLLDMLQVITDLIMVGTLSSLAIAAVGIGIQSLMFVFALMTLFQVGTNALISRFYGAKKMVQASVTLSTLLRMAFWMAIPIVAGWHWGAASIYVLFGTEASVVELGSGYVQILTVMLPFVLMRTVMVSALHAIGDTKTPMYIKIGSILLNIGLNYLLIFGHCGLPAWGVAGAAVATVIVNILECVIYLYLYMAHKTLFRPMQAYSRLLWKRALRVGVPAMVERILTVASYMVFTAIIAGYGTEAIAGYQIGLRIEGIAFMPGFGFTIAAMVLMGQGLGAKNPEQSREDVWLVLKYAIGLMFGLSFFMVLTPEIMAGWFTDDAATIAQASLYLQIVGLSQIPLAFYFVLSGALRGAGASRQTLKINLISLWVVRLIPAFVLSYYFDNILWVYIAMIADTFVKAWLLWRAFDQGTWQKIKV